VVFLRFVNYGLLNLVGATPLRGAEARDVLQAVLELVFGNQNRDYLDPRVHHADDDRQGDDQPETPATFLRVALGGWRPYRNCIVNGAHTKMLARVAEAVEGNGWARCREDQPVPNTK